jgi:hypothetical protein
LPELEQAAYDGRLRAVYGFGPRIYSRTAWFTGCLLGLFLEHRFNSSYPDAVVSIIIGLILATAAVF